MELEQINWPSTLFWIDNVENKPETYTYKLQPQWLKVLKEAVKIGRIAQESGHRPNAGRNLQSASDARQVANKPGMF